MKNWILLATLFTGFVAQAQVTSIPGKQYREFEANIIIANGETKSFLLQVNTDLRVDTYGEPEIPAHGFYNYVVTGSIVESGQTCSFEALLTQGRGEVQITDTILKSNVDRGADIKLVVLTKRFPVL